MINYILFGEYWFVVFWKCWSREGWELIGDINIIIESL